MADFCGVGTRASASLQKRVSGRRYEALRADAGAVRATQAAVAGACAGLCVAGPPGAIAGSILGAGSQSAADASYLGDPKTWARFDALAAKGAEERRAGFGGECADGDADAAGVGGGVAERAWLARRDARTAPALEKFLGERLEGRVALCGSGGGLRAATAFLGLLAEAETCGLLEATTYAAGVSGSCWTLAALYVRPGGNWFPSLAAAPLRRD